MTCCKILLYGSLVAAGVYLAPYGYGIVAMMVACGSKCT